MQYKSVFDHDLSTEKSETSKIYTQSRISFGRRISYGLKGKLVEFAKKSLIITFSYTDEDKVPHKKSPSRNEETSVNSIQDDYYHSIRTWANR